MENIAFLWKTVVKSDTWVLTWWMTCQLLHLACCCTTKVLWIHSALLSRAVSETCPQLYTKAGQKPIVCLLRMAVGNTWLLSPRFLSSTSALFSSLYQCQCVSQSWSICSCLISAFRQLHLCLSDNVATAVLNSNSLCILCKSALYQRLIQFVLLLLSKVFSNYLTYFNKTEGF